MLGKIIPTCYYTGKELEESEIEVKIDPSVDEKILFFEIDDNPNKNSPFRRIGLKGTICDSLVYYYKLEREQRFLYNGKRRHQRAKITLIICLAELKYKNVEVAVEQIINTYNFIINQMDDEKCKRDCRREKCKPLGYKAYICIHGSSPRQISDEQKDKLNAIFRSRNWIITPRKDMTDFLRKRYS